MNSNTFTLSPLSIPFTFSSIPTRPSKNEIYQSLTSYSIKSSNYDLIYPQSPTYSHTSTSPSSSSQSYYSDEFELPQVEKKYRRPRGGKRARRATAAKLRRAESEAIKQYEIEELKNQWEIGEPYYEFDFGMEVEREVVNLPIIITMDWEGEWEQLAREIEASRMQL